MSESVPESRPSRGNILTRKVGPLPVWAWMGIGLAVAVGYYLIQKKNASNSPAASASTTGTTNSSLVPQFVNQVYTNGQPPPAHHPRGGAAPNPPTPPTAIPPTTPPTQASGTVTMSLPDGSGGWEQVVFPSQGAVDQWTAWNQAFVNDNHAQAYRSQWNTELTSLGVKRTDGKPLSPPSNVTGNPYDAL